MVKFMNKIPAGTFLVPMLLSALLYTFLPNLFTNIGGVTESFLGGGNTGFIIGMLCFCSGIGIDVKSIGQLMKRHGVIIVAKIAIAIAVSLLFVNLFGQEGIFGISALAFTVAICSMNPALYISLVSDLGNEIDKAAFGLVGMLSIPALPMFIYAISGQGEISWMPIVSTVIPLILGIVLGNLDKDFTALFDKGISVLLPLLGWKIGQGMNLIEGLQSGVSGLLLAILFYLLMSPLVVLDKNGLKNDGIPALSMISVAGVSASFPIIVAQATPEVAPFVMDATAQVLTASIITVIVTPILVRKLNKKTKDLTTRHSK